MNESVALWKHFFFLEILNEWMIRDGKKGTYIPWHLINYQSKSRSVNQKVRSWSGRRSIWKGLWKNTLWDCDCSPGLLSSIVIQNDWIYQPHKPKVIFYSMKALVPIQWAMTSHCRPSPLHLLSLSISPRLLLVLIYLFTFKLIYNV